jgi:hypothetical protein
MLPHMGARLPWDIPKVSSRSRFAVALFASGAGVKLARHGRGFREAGIKGE